MPTLDKADSLALLLILRFEEIWHGKGVIGAQTFTNGGHAKDVVVHVGRGSFMEYGKPHPGASHFCASIPCGKHTLRVRGRVRLFGPTGVENISIRELRVKAIGVEGWNIWCAGHDTTRRVADLALGGWHFEELSPIRNSLLNEMSAITRDWRNWCGWNLSDDSDCSKDPEKFELRIAPFPFTIDYKPNPEFKACVGQD